MTQSVVDNALGVRGLIHKLYMNKCSEFMYYTNT